MGSAALLTLSSCSLKDVRVDYDPGASLTELKTYSWVVNAGAYGGRDLVDGGSDRRLGYRSSAESVDYGTYESDERRDDSPLFSSLLDNRIRGAVDSELLRLGYELSTEDDADFRIAYRLMLDDRREVRDLGYYSAYQFGYHCDATEVGIHAIIRRHQQWWCRNCVADTDAVRIEYGLLGRVGAHGARGCPSATAATDPASHNARQRWKSRWCYCHAERCETALVGEP